MKSFVSLALSASLVLGLACGDNSDNVLGGLPDAGGQPPDAAPNVGACGIVLAPSIDLGTEAFIGAVVFFHSPDGALLGVDYSDVKGEAAFDACVANTTITAIMEPTSGFFQVYTYLGVQPGDTAYVRSPVEDEPPPVQLFADLNVTSNQDVSAIAPVDNFQVYNGCNSTGAAISDGVPEVALEDLNPGCLGTDMNTDVIAGIRRDSNIVGYAFAKDVPITSGTEGANAPNPVTLPAWTPGNLDNACVVSNLPGLAQYLAFGCNQSVDGVEFSGWGDELSDPAPVESVVTNFGLPDGFGESSLSFAVWYEYLGLDDYSGRSIFQVRPFVRTVTTDALDALPVLRSFAFAGQSTGQPALTWQTDAPVTATMGIFELYIETSSIDVVWTVVTPNTSAGRLPIPPLEPPYDSLFELAETASVYPEQASLVDFSFTDYRSIITTPGFDPEGLLDAGEISTNLPEPPEEARLRQTTWELD